MEHYMKKSPLSLERISPKAGPMLIVAAIMLAYAMYIPTHMSVDSWTVNALYHHLDTLQEGHWQEVWEEARFICFSSGRISRGVLFLLFAICRKATWLTLPWVNVVAIAFLCLSGLKLWSLLSSCDRNSNTVTLLCCILAVCNPFFTDWMQYQECGLYYPLGLYLAICAAEVLLADGVSFRKWIKASAMLTISCGFYQITLQYFVLTAVMLAMMKAEPENVLKSFLIKALTAMSAYAIASAVQFGCIFFFGNSRRATHTLEAIVVALGNAQKNLWQMEAYTGNAWSRLFSVIVIALVIRLCLIALLSNNKNSTKLSYLIASLLGFGGFYISLFLPLIVSELWFTQRSMVGFWGIPMLFTVYGNYMKGERRAIRYGDALISVASIVLVFVNIITCIEFCIGLHKTNAMDTMRASLVMDVITEYEHESGTVIENVAFYQDQYPSYAYKGIFCTYENNQSAWSVSWACGDLLKLVSGRSFTETDYPETFFETHYDVDNWDSWCEDQVICEGNTAFIAVY